MFQDKVIDKGEWNFEGETTVMWNQMANCIRKVTKQVLGESKGKRHDNKETWQWGVEVQEAIWEKRRYKVWRCTRNVENYEMYKKAKKEAKKVVGDARCKAYDDLYNSLKTRK